MSDEIQQSGGQAAPSLACSAYWILFEHMSNEYGLSLLDSQLSDIVLAVDEMRKPWGVDAVSRMDAMEKTLRFILDECDWEEYRCWPCGGGDERIGPAIRKVLSANVDVAPDAEHS